ncbi:hypothetical protein BJX68DRAFT_259149 [Aspergillus pseudodeflectus]|uniref:Uncharacterized protein n=1 Tax=Aspergillus pseudodeflectus TaxID=176178 RepID=A0ABR4JF60_9EURO
MASTRSSGIDYNKREISSYEQSRTIIVTIGNKNYSIPENYIQAHLLPQTRQYKNPRIILGDIDSDIAETQRIEIEYKRSIQVSYAARKFIIRGLDILAQNYSMALSESLSIFQILRGAKLIFSKLPGDEEWFRNYLHSKLSSSFAADETTFQLDEATEVGSETEKDGGESCEQSTTGPLFEPSGGRNRGSGWVPPHKRSRAAAKSSTHDIEQPCGEPAIELLPADREEAI